MFSLFMFGKDMCIVQGHVCSCWTRTRALCKVACVHVKQGRVYRARSRVFILSKDASPEDEAASLCPCLHLHKVLTRSLTDGVDNFPCKVAALLLGS